MDIAVAEATVRATREEAAADARHDLQEMIRRAVEAGRDRSRRIIKTSRIDPRTGELRYNPAGRLLRDWYFHVYLNSLRSSLGEPAAVVDAQQIEDTASLLRRLRPDADPLACLQLVAVVRNTGVDDASHTAADVLDHLATVGARRAVRHAADDRFGDDTLATHITRHWYLHGYDDTIRGATTTRHPLAATTRGQEREVARAISTGEVRQLVGHSGVPLLTAPATHLIRPDRDQATDSTGPSRTMADPEPGGEPLASLRARASWTWNELDHDQRAQWLSQTDAAHLPPDIGWSDLADNIQIQIIQHYRDTHPPDLGPETVHGPRIDREPSEAAMIMFNHHQPIEAPAADPRHTNHPATPGGDRLAVDAEQTDTVRRAPTL